MSEFTSQHTGEDSFEPSLIPPEEIAQLYRVWNTFGEGIRQFDYSLTGANTEIHPDVVRITTGLPMRPEHTLEIYTPNPADGHRTTEMSIVFRLPKRRQDKQHTFHLFTLTADGSESLYGAFVSEGKLTADGYVADFDEPLTPLSGITIEDRKMLDRIHTELMDHLAPKIDVNVSDKSRRQSSIGATVLKFLHRS
jgi:hypothetical protein